MAATAIQDFPLPATLGESTLVTLGGGGYVDIELSDSSGAGRGDSGDKGRVGYVDIELSDSGGAGRRRLC
ncbi:MAG: hypothetical protein FWH55_09225 [Oscillospiraceae bacterium]|nr:hypothetical protein [Oscillospiraceae bacterium]